MSQRISRLSGERMRSSGQRKTHTSSLVSGRQREEKQYDLDRDSFSMGVDNVDENGEPIDVLRRIEMPLTWARLASGVRIIDLHDNHFDQVLTMMRRTFIQEEALCKSLRMWEDDESVASMMNICTVWMRDGTSLGAIQEGTNELLGALITRVVSLLDHTRTFSRIRYFDEDKHDSENEEKNDKKDEKQTKDNNAKEESDKDKSSGSALKKGEAFQKIIAFRCQMHKQAEVFDKFDVTTYLRIYAMCVRPVHRGKGIGMALLKSAMQLGAALGQNVVMGIFSTVQLQSMGYKLGMRPVYEVTYAQYLQDGEVVFDDPGAGNYSAIVMAKRLPRIAQL